METYAEQFTCENALYAVEYNRYRNQGSQDSNVFNNFRITTENVAINMAACKEGCAHYTCFSECK